MYTTWPELSRQDRPRVYKPVQTSLTWTLQLVVIIWQSLSNFVRIRIIPTEINIKKACKPRRLVHNYMSAWSGLKVIKTIQIRVTLSVLQHLQFLRCDISWLSCHQSIRKPSWLEFQKVWWKGDEKQCQHRVNNPTEKLPWSRAANIKEIQVMLPPTSTIWASNIFKDQIYITNIFSSWLTDHLDNHQYKDHLTLPRQNGNSLLKVTFNL